MVRFRRIVPPAPVFHVIYQIKRLAPICGGRASPVDKSVDIPPKSVLEKLQLWREGGADLKTELEPVRKYWKDRGGCRCAGLGHRQLGRGGTGHRARGSCGGLQLGSHRPSTGLGLLGPAICHTIRWQPSGLGNVSTCWTEELMANAACPPGLGPHPGYLPPPNAAFVLSDREAENRVTVALWSLGLYTPGLTPIPLLEVTMRDTH